MKVRLRRVFFLLIVILAACARPTPTPTDTAFVQNTPEPSVTPTHIPTYTHRNSPSRVPSPTISDLETELQCWARGTPFDRKVKVSPDGNWAAAGCYDLVPPLCHENPYITILELGGIKRWKYYFQDLTGKTPCGESPHTYYPEGCYIQVNWNIDHWSEDSRFVFFAIDLLLERGIYPFAVTHFGLYRVDVTTGIASAWLPFITRLDYLYAFSSDGAYFVYASAVDGYRLHINGIETGVSDELVLPVPIDRMSNMVWAPDNRTFAVSAMHPGWSLQGRSSLFTVHMPEMRVDWLLPNVSKIWWPVKWESETAMILGTYSDTGDYPFPTFQFDLQSHGMFPLPAP